MIEFNGILSDKCKIETANRLAKNAGFVFFITTIIIGAISIIVGIIRDTWIYSLILTAFFIAVTIFAFIPSKRMLHYKIPTRLIVDNDTIARTAIGSSKPLVTKPISIIKKVIDVGEWYYFIFKFGDISNSWVCQKDLIVNGTIEEFENIFKDKIERKAPKINN